MQKETELDKVKRRIRALSEFTVDKGCTEEEAYTMMEKVGELLDVYNLTMAECMVDVRNEKCITKLVSTGFMKKHIVSSCLGPLGDLCQCKVWNTGGFRRKRGRVYNGKQIAFFGFESDTELAEYLFLVIKSALLNAVEEFKKTDAYINPAYVYRNSKTHKYYHYDQSEEAKAKREKRRIGGQRRIATHSFMTGFMDRINHRIWELVRERKAEAQRAAEATREEMEERMIGASMAAQAEAASQLTGTALIIKEKEDHIEEEYAKLGMKLVYRKVKTVSYNSEALNAGSEAGKSVNLNRPLGGSQKVAGYL